MDLPDRASVRILISHCATDPVARPGKEVRMSSDGTQPQLGYRNRIVNAIGTPLVEGFHLLGLFTIGGATVWAAAVAFAAMARKGGASIEDLLLLFIYLEIGAMVGIYFKTNHMPVRFLIYVAITALTRHLLGFVNTQHKPESDILITAGAIFILAVSVLVLRYASYSYPSAPVGSPEAKRAGGE